MKYALLLHAGQDAAARVSEGIDIRLHDPSDATTLRRRDGELVITDGPFAELAEPVVGFEMRDADGLEDAVRDAARLAAASEGAVEVREVWAEFGETGAPAADPPAGARRYLFLHTNPTERAELPGTADEPPLDWFAAEHTRRTVLEGDRLRPATPATAATVRIRDGELLISHGPYAELAEEIAGYDLVAVADLDEAIALARPHPTLAIGAIEIRPLWTT